MSTDAQRNANRENAKKSTGPVPKPGKNKARFNARRHGLTGQLTAQSFEDDLAFKKFEAGVTETLKPGSPYEACLVAAIARDQWRLNGASATEQNMMSLRHEDFAATTHADTPEFHAAAVRARIWLDDDYTNIPLYQTRIRRLIDANMRDLKALQTTRLAAEAQAKAAEEKLLEEAKLLLRLAAMDNQALDPTTLDPEIGFVFSNPVLRSRLNRELTLERARFYAASDWNRDRRYPMPRITLPDMA